LTTFESMQLTSNRRLISDASCLFTLTNKNKL
jgi:hypothetical protein